MEEGVVHASANFSIPLLHHPGGNEHNSGRPHQWLVSVKRPVKIDFQSLPVK
jgi:hypothetical protein